MDALLRIRVHDRPGALERVLGVIRRKSLAVSKLSLHAPADGMHEIVLRYDGVRSSTERMTAELSNLYDVEEVTAAPAPDPHTREMVLAHVRSHEETGLGEAARVVHQGDDGVVVELTGTPAELDDILDRLRATGALTRAVRTGELLVPDGQGGRPVDGAAKRPPAPNDYGYTGPGDGATHEPGDDTA